MQRFADKVVMVTGAGSGIGKASAERIAAEGGAVFCVDLNAEAVAATMAGIAEVGGEASSHVCNVGDESSVAACVSACVERCGISKLPSTMPTSRVTGLRTLILAA